MKVLIILEFIFNLLILLFFYMHMFQLNSYFFKKYIIWIKNNFKKILLQIFLVAFSLLLIYFNNNISYVFCILILGLSIFYNFPKNKAKVKLNITNRVIRLFITEFIIIIFNIILFNIDNYIFIKLTILNIFSSIICIIANFINYPLEYLIRFIYIYQAKNILKKYPNLIVIGVTGSYGKTSVKNYLEKTLSTKYEVLTTKKNYNTTMGVVKTIRNDLKPTHQIFICEMGATKCKDIKKICDIVNPKIGVITSIGPQHLESFKTIDNIIKTKYELADSVKKNNGVIFLNYDNEYIANHFINMNVISYGINNESLNYNSYNLKSSSKGLSFSLSDSFGKEIKFSTKLIGKHNIINITAAIGVANYLGIPLNDLVFPIKDIKNIEHRLQLLSNGYFNIIDDSYNANPISSKSALDTLNEFEGKKIIVTPGLVELGREQLKFNFEFGQYMSNICDYIFLVKCKNYKNILNGILSKNFNKNNIFIVNSPNEAIKQILNMNIHEKVTVLLENDLPDNYNL